MPRRKRAVLGFSTALGDFLSRALLERALRGFLYQLALATPPIWLKPDLLHLP